MGAYGTPEHLPPNKNTEGETYPLKKNQGRKLNTIQKIGVWVYAISIAFLSLCMTITLDSYGKHKVLGCIFAFTFTALSILFLYKIKKNKKSLPFALLSIIPLILYFSFYSSTNVTTEAQTPQIKTTVANPKSAPPIEPSSSEDVTNYKKQCCSYKYKDVARNPNNYKDKMAKFTGNVEQVQESWGTNIILVNVTKSEYGLWEDTIYVEYKPKSENESRILEEDTITLYGKLNGLKTYTAVLGNQISVPYLQAEYVEIEE